jgi:hypothetical protein
MTDTYNPIIGEPEELPRLRLFRPYPTPEPGVALVLFREGQPLVTLWPKERLTAGEVRWGNYKIVYKVDVTEHSFSFDYALPCKSVTSDKSDAFNFQAEVEVTCSVDDPATIVERQITDACEALKPLIVRTMRSVSRNYNVEQSAMAEEAIMQAIEGETYDVGLKVNRISVEVHLEKEARDYIRKQEDFWRRAVLDKAEIDSKRKIEAAQAKLEEERRKFREAEDQWERERMKLEERAGLERQEMRMEFYGSLMKKGVWGLLVSYLANHPDDVPGVIQMVRQQRQIELENSLRALEGLHVEANLEAWDEPVQEVLRHLVSIVESKINVPALGESKERRALPEVEHEEAVERETGEIGEAKETGVVAGPKGVEDGQGSEVEETEENDE